MSTILPNEFTSYQLNEQEALEGAILTETQRQVIQNELSFVAANILALEFTPEEPMKFAQQEAELRGQLGIYRYILEKSVTAQEVLYPSEAPTP